jgi:hypothetical protein
MAFARMAVILAVCLFLSMGCLQSGPFTPNSNLSLARASTPTDTCIKACRAARTLGQNLDNGPCLLNPIPDAAQWVCDIAHNPRQAVDDEAANQCSVYADGQAGKFVELTPDCEVIRTG